MRFRVFSVCLVFAALGVCARADTLREGDGFIAVPGGPVWYEVTGDGSGVPLLVLHGGPGGTSCGFSRLDPLGAERPIVRYDQLGSGRSGRPDDPSLWTVERFVEALHTVRASLGLERMHLLGHSWGGALAAAYVLEKGTDGIVSLTLSSPLLSTPAWVADANLLRTRLPTEVQETLARHEAAGTIESEEYTAASAAFYERFVYAGERPSRPSECEGAPGNSFIYEYMWGPTEFNATGTLIDFDVTPRLGEIDIPVLFIAGEFDEARPETLAGFSERVAGARLEVIPGVAHASLSKAAEQYMHILESFLDDTEGSP
jgi:proline iminopeptidase